MWGKGNALPPTEVVVLDLSPPACHLIGSDTIWVLGRSNVHV